jgi:positive regulator of sigma E activity
MLQKAINIGVLASIIGYICMFVYSQLITYFPLFDVEYSWPLLFFLAGMATFAVYTYYKKWFDAKYVWQVVTVGIIVNYLLFKFIEYYLNK